ncbi:hypothetical protein QBC46DRAFT_371421 [Diplogelasinospora grovesii]|uniref:Secreted protein n=1 Tax=Diplogelasinospora grovesii TaxID=303347 RepID=A0AAN6NHN2_9PEZI|nr:hypothetical protein QBC46DRAFT_371421 [Diplogelasinospora grovesii]
MEWQHPPFFPFSSFPFSLVFTFAASLMIEMGEVKVHQGGDAVTAGRFCHAEAETRCWLLRGVRDILHLPQ